MLCTRSTSGDVWLISCENSRLPRQEAAGGGVTENRGGGKLFSVPRKVSSEFVPLAVLTWDRWTGREVGDGGIGRAVVGLRLG